MTTNRPDRRKRAESDITVPEDEVVHPVQPYQAVKTYVCPGCTSTIEPGVGHVVVVPEETPDLRRHWHRGCWYKETRRLGYHRSR